MKRYLHNGRSDGCYEILEIEGEWHNEEQGSFETPVGARIYGTFATSEGARADFEKKLFDRIAETRGRRQEAERALRRAQDFHDEATDTIIKALSLPTFIRPYKP